MLLTQIQAGVPEPYDLAKQRGIFTPIVIENLLTTQDIVHRIIQNRFSSTHSKDVVMSDALLVRVQTEVCRAQCQEDCEGTQDH